MARSIKLNNKAVNIEQIACVDFLDSGRAVVIVSGLTEKKQHIPVEPAEARILRDFFEHEYSLNAGTAAPSPNAPAKIRKARA